MTEEVFPLEPPYRIVREFNFAEVMYPSGTPTGSIHGLALGLLVSVLPGEDQETTLVIFDREKAAELRDQLNELLARSDTHH